MSRSETVQPTRGVMPRREPEVWLHEAALGDDFFAYINVPGAFGDPPEVVAEHNTLFFDTSSKIALDADGAIITANLPVSADEPRIVAQVGEMRARIGAGDVHELGEPGPLFLLASPRHENYYHFLFDDLGRLGFYEALDALPEARFPIPRPNAWQRELYGLAGIEARLLPLPNGVVFLRDVWVAPRGLAKIAEIRSRGWDRLMAVGAQVPDAAPGGPGPARIYITREGTRHRRLLNEGEVRECVGKHGFEIVRPETMPVAAQIRLYRGADVVLGVFGAGLANAAYMRPGKLLLEIAPAKSAALPGVHNAICSAVAGCRELRYGLLSAPGAEVDRESHDFAVPVDWLEALIERTTA